MIWPPQVPGRRLADQADVQTDHRAAALGDDLGAHLVGDAGGDEHLDVDVLARRGSEDRDLRILSPAGQRDSLKG